MNISAKSALLLLLPCAAVMAIAYFAPFAIMVTDSLRDPAGGWSLVNYGRVFGDSFYWQITAYTFTMSLWVTLLTFIIGYPLAYYTTFHVRSALVKRIIYIVVVTPLFTSNIVRSFGWMILLGRRGVVNESLAGMGVIDSPLQLMFNETGIVIGMTYVMLPFMVLTTTSIMQNFDGRLSEASLDLGATPFSTFLRVVFPLSLPGVVAGSLIVFTLSVSAYVTPSVLSGGKVTVMSSVIFQQYGANLDYPFGAALSIFLLGATLLLIGIYLAILRRSAPRERKA